MCSSNGTIHIFRLNSISEINSVKQEIINESNNQKQLQAWLWSNLPVLATSSYHNNFNKSILRIHIGEVCSISHSIY